GEDLERPIGSAIGDLSHDLPIEKVPLTNHLLELSAPEGLSKTRERAAWADSLELLLVPYEHELSSAAIDRAKKAREIACPQERRLVDDNDRSRCHLEPPCSKRAKSLKEVLRPDPELALERERPLA